jgi:hypothetical protein
VKIFGTKACLTIDMTFPSRDDYIFEINSY